MSVDRKAIAATCARIGSNIDMALKVAQQEDARFALLLFDANGSDVVWMSNADKKTVVLALQETIRKLS